MKSKGVRIRVLVEDQALERFCGTALRKFGFNKHEIYVNKSYPKSGKGSGKDFVEAMFSDEMKLYRIKCNYQRVALLVATEADELTVKQRAEQLEESLEKAHCASRAKAERIAYWIPKWSIETWGFSLTGALASLDLNEPDNPEGESLKFRAQARHIDWENAGQVFAKFFSDTLEIQATALPSIQAALDETKRIVD